MVTNLEALNKRYPHVFTPDVAEHHAELAKLHDSMVQNLEKKHQVECLVAVKNAIAAHPQYASNLFRLAYSLIGVFPKRETIPASMFVLEKALSRQRGNAERFLTLAQSAVGKAEHPGRVVDAVFWASARKPDHSEDFFKLAHRAMDAGLDPVETVSLVERAIEMRLPPQEVFTTALHALEERESVRDALSEIGQKGKVK